MAKCKLQLRTTSLKYVSENLLGYGTPKIIVIIIIVTNAYNVLGAHCDLGHYRFMGILPSQELPAETR